MLGIAEQRLTIAVFLTAYSRFNQAIRASLKLEFDRSLVRALSSHAILRRRFGAKKSSARRGNPSHGGVLLLNNGAMDRTQKIKTGVLLALAVVSLALFILWVTDVIGLGLAVVLMIVMTAASVGVRVWAENSGRQSE